MKTVRVVVEELILTSHPIKKGKLTLKSGSGRGWVASIKPITYTTVAKNAIVFDIKNQPVRV